MSRIGRLPVVIPHGVDVNIDENEVTVKGPKGTLKQDFHPGIQVEIVNNTIMVYRNSDDRYYRALHGLTRSLLANMVTGVAQGYTRELDIVGVGYRAAMSGNKLTLRVGFSHQVDIDPLPGVTISVEGTNKIKVSGIDKQVVGQMAALIRKVRPIDSFKGKGIKYSDEVLRLKPGKTGKAIGRKKS